MTNKTMSPLLLQSMLGDISQRRALAMALRARESGGGQMVSGRYVPNFGALGGAISRGLFGDPLEQLRQEEQGALTGYSDELAGATQGMLEIDPTTAEAGDFAQRTARSQVAGVSPELINKTLARRSEWNALSDFQRQIAQLIPDAGGGAQPAGGGGAVPGALTAGSGQAPAGMPQGQSQSSGAGQLFEQGGGRTPLAGLTDAKLVMMAVALPKGHPMAALADAELKSRDVKGDAGGVITRGGRLIGIMRPDGVLIGPNGQPEDITGGIETARAASKAAAEADARASRTPVSIPHGDTTRMGFATELPGYGGGQPQQAPQRAPQAGGSGKIKVNFEGTPEEIRKYVEIALRESAGGGAPAPAPSGGSGGYPIGVGMGETEKARLKADINVDEANRKEQRGVQIKKSADRYEEVTKAYQGTQDMKPVLSQLRKLDASGVMTGPAQDAWRAFANVANSAIPGANLDSKRLANSQTFDSEISKMVQGIAKNFPGAQSDRELQQLLNSLPSRSQTAAARKELYDQIDARIAKIEAGYRDASKVYRERGDLIGWEPPTSGGGAQQGASGGQVLRFDAQGNPIK